MEIVNLVLKKSRKKKRVWKNQRYGKLVDLYLFISYIVGVYQGDFKIFVCLHGRCHEVDQMQSQHSQEILLL